MRPPSTRQKIIIYTLMALVMIFFVGPILWFILLAFRHPSDAYNLPPEFIFQPDLGNFHTTFVDPGNNAQQLVNSLIVSSGATLLSLPFALSAAYALSRFAMRGKDFIMNWYISLLIAPPIVFVIPYFILMSWIGWAGTYQAMILTLQTLAIPFSVWLLKSFMDEVPIDLEEAAWVDGANRFSAFLRIVIPLALPGNYSHLHVHLRLQLEQCALPARSQQAKHDDPAGRHHQFLRLDRRLLGAYCGNRRCRHAPADDHLFALGQICRPRLDLRRSERIIRPTRANSAPARLL